MRSDGGRSAPLICGDAPVAALSDMRHGAAMRFGFSGNFWLMLALILVVTAGGIAGPRVYRTAVLGSGIMAQTLCEGVFISHREPHDLLTQDLAGPGYGLLQFFQPRVDRKAEKVTTSAYGLAPRTSIYRDGLGCTLLDGRSEAALRAQAAGLFAARAPANEAAEWPEGERVSLGTPPEGVKATEVERAIDAIFLEPNPKHPRNTRALVVVYGGRIVAERYANGFDASTALPGWSMSKTATNALVGLRVKDGKLALDDSSLMPEWKGKADPRRAITLNDLMRMTSGLAFDENTSDRLSDVVQMLYVQRDPAKFAASKPLEHKPGTYWSYSSGTTNIISYVLRETFADEGIYLRFPEDRLFGPLGMRTAVLQPDAGGTFIDSSFLYASARDWARLGLLFLRDGMWRGERLLPKGWVAYTLAPTKPSPDEQYGAQVWLKLPDSPTPGEPTMPDDAYYMLGYEDQTVAIVPSRDLVIVRLGLTWKGGDWDNARDLAPLVNAFPAPAR
jgi:CubicO group peptidase (beta-lactamase class C family)